MMDGLLPQLLPGIIDWYSTPTANFAAPRPAEFTIRGIGVPADFKSFRSEHIAFPLGHGCYAGRTAEEQKKGTSTGVKLRGPKR
ncbi:hypothetical protein NDU88_009109 [Pleurodeles waltl]|uniref:Uncharacterized protein n=1 Tax=Pleurodeles waltl TaxID=8319 RepID=A0AAV7PR61_PLEWA|nr:hypothetical protein NDU88_009109 [Pleurodeles waltl]